MHRVISQPFDGTGDILSWGEPDDALTASTEIATRVAVFLREIGDGVKATKKGNLGRKCVQNVHAEIAALHPNIHDFKPNTEEDSAYVHPLRYLLTMVGWVKKRKGVFSLTKKGERVRDDGLTRAPYITLLRTYCSEFNWGYCDGYGPVLIVQRGFLAALFLARNDQEFTDSEVLAARFIDAFPHGLDDLESYGGRLQPADIFTSCINYRFFRNFATPFGLLELGEEDRRRCSYRVSPLHRALLLWDR